MEKYKIKLTSHGFTYWAGRKIKNIEKYDSLEDVPTFNVDEHPITEGLKLLEKNGRLEIVDVTPKPDREKEDDTTETTEEDTTEEDTTEEDTTEETEEDYTKEELEEMTVAELDDLAKELGLSGYSSLVKAEKIDLILES